MRPNEPRRGPSSWVAERLQTGRVRSLDPVVANICSAIYLPTRQHWRSPAKEACPHAGLERVSRVAGDEHAVLPTLSVPRYEPIVLREDTDPGGTS